MADLGVKGAISGGVTGASIGTSILPGVGTVLGGLLGATIGGIGGSQAERQKTEARERLEAIPGVDPTMVAFADELGRERKAIRSGFTTEFQVGKGLFEQANAGAMSVAAEVARDNPALALTMLQGSNAGFSTNINKLLGTTAAKDTAYLSTLTNLMGDISQRELDVEMFKTSQGMAEAVASEKDINQNFLSSIMQIPGVIDKGFPGLDSLFSGGGGASATPNNINIPGTPILVPGGPM